MRTISELARPETQIITFDCYGTLIDWESGIVAVIEGWLARHGRTASRAEILHQYAAFEPEAQVGLYRRYRDVLAVVMQRFSGSYGIPLAAGDERILAESLASWPAFPDVADALVKLASRYRLVILSNVDRDLFEGTRAQLPPVLAGVVTAEDVQAYKPSHRHFHAAMEQYACTPEQILHVAESLFHDILPCRELGIPHCWINRKGKTMGTGATRGAVVQPEAEAASLDEFTRRVLGA
ncbi:MAG TPA: haloacid dehalogenase type II [Kiritimatiellia bacterium]|nr:haloacid dehalogenase type II [Kiritimatiellia bacterium]HMP34597.1 haloacid dehalogenase type II [Kiritimatiellia bacterium]